MVAVGDGPWLLKLRCGGCGCVSKVPGSLNFSVVAEVVCARSLVAEIAVWWLWLLRQWSLVALDELLVVVEWSSIQDLGLGQAPARLAGQDGVMQAVLSNCCVGLGRREHKSSDRPGQAWNMDVK